jgi:hypothetical protein
MPQLEPWQLERAPRVCPICKTSFIPSRKWQVYCNPNCRTQFHGTAARKRSPPPPEELAAMLRQVRYVKPAAYEEPKITLTVEPSQRRHAPGAPPNWRDRYLTLERQYAELERENMLLQERIANLLADRPV